MYADSVKFVGDENGWEMHVSCDEGDLVFNIHGIAVELAAHADETIGAYKREHDYYKAEFAASFASAGTGLRAAIFSNDPTEVECSGYALDDPKHPTYLDRMSAVWDNRDKGE